MQSPPAGNRGRRAALTAVALASVAGLASAASAQTHWYAQEIHPADALWSEALGIHDGKPVGWFGFTSDLEGHAALWTALTPNNIIDLTPPPMPDGTVGALAHAGYGGRQGGSVVVEANVQHAALWSGTAGSWVDLHPVGGTAVRSRILAMDGDKQVGYWQGSFANLPALWSGTAASFVDLTPPAYVLGEARDIRGDQVVGVAVPQTPFQLHAGVWLDGTAASFVDLHPATGADNSIADCTDGVHQYGAISNNTTNSHRVGRWSGTPQSFVDMTPPGLQAVGIRDATDHDQQVGAVTFNSNGFADPRAAFWAGTAASYIDLHALLPDGYAQSEASGIWRAPNGTTYVVGYAAASNDREDYRAMVWIGGGAGTDLRVTIDEPDCASFASEPLVFTVNVQNFGLDISGPVTLTVDLPSSDAALFQSAVPAPVAVSPTQLTFNLSPVTSGVTSEVAITLAPVTPGATATLSAVAATTADYNALNDTGSASSIIRTPAAVDTAPATALLSTDPALASSLIPGGTAHYTVLGEPAVSPSGTRWAFHATTDLQAHRDEMLFQAQAGGEPSVLLQEGIEIVDPLFEVPAKSFDDGMAVNDSGRIAFAALTSEVAILDEVIAAADSSGAVTFIARETDDVPGGLDVYQPEMDSVQTDAAGNVYFMASSTVITDYVIRSDGVTSQTLFHQGETVPANQTGAPFPWGDLFNGTFRVTPDGQHTLLQGQTSDGADPKTIVAFDNSVVIQEGVLVDPSFTSPASGDRVADLCLAPNGDWYAAGTNADGQGWLVKNGLVLARTGDEIVPGTGETWAAFTSIDVDDTGTFIIGGVTSSTSVYEDTVLVRNGQTVVARENDPVDLDGNGDFDDARYIRTFQAKPALLDGAVLALVTLRGVDGACDPDNTDLGQALVSIPLGDCPADLDGSGAVDVFDLLGYLDLWFNNDAGAELTGDQPASIDVFDLLAYLDVWFAGC